MTLPCLAALLLTHELNFQSGSSQDEHFEHFWLRIDTILQCPGGWEVTPLGLWPFPSWCAQGPLPWQLPGVSPSRGHRITHHHGPLPGTPLHLCSWNVCGLDRSILSVPAKDHCGRAGRQSHQEQVPHVTHEMSAQAVAKSIFNTEIDIEELHQPRPVASAPSARARFCKSCLTAPISNGFFGQCCGQTAVAARAQLNCGFRCTGLFGAGVLALRNGIGVVQRGGAEVGNGAIRA